MGVPDLAEADLIHLRRCVELASEAGLGVEPPPVRALPVNQVAPDLLAQGPVPGLDEQVRQLHHRFRGLT